MLLQILKAKIHRATVTDANLNYKGSITIDKALLMKSGILPFEKVDVVNINNGERFSTYVIEAEENSGTICLNGAAARLVQPQDKIIVMAYALMDEKEAETHSPVVLLMDEDNRILTRQ
ncbi:MAG: aspartate 1-decarboxylase [Dysgonamonadaceae bacterium]|jgi:aspartate 1-decarboxylase|nr:aspartate 1-decarboxylase [Dysgonamonadaceae bacterium]